jgi:hypothetical protein
MPGWIEVDRTVIEHAHGFRVIATRSTDYARGTTEIRRVIPIASGPRKPSRVRQVIQRVRDWWEWRRVRRGAVVQWPSRMQATWNRKSER